MMLGGIGNKVVVVVADTEVVVGADTEVVVGADTELSKSLSSSLLLLLLKTARIAAEVEPQNGIGFLVAFVG